MHTVGMYLKQRMEIDDYLLHYKLSFTLNLNVNVAYVLKKLNTQSLAIFNLMIPTTVREGIDRRTSHYLISVWEFKRYYNYVMISRAFGSDFGSLNKLNCAIDLICMLYNFHICFSISSKS